MHLAARLILKTLEQQFADGLPADHSVLIHGGRTELEGNATVLYIQEREVLRVEFCRDDHERPPSGETSEVDSSSSSSSSSGGSGDETRAPSLIPGAAVTPVAKSRTGNGRTNLKRPVPGSDAVGSCLSLCLVHPTGTIAAPANDFGYRDEWSRRVGSGLLCFGLRLSSGLRPSRPLQAFCLPAACSFSDGALPWLWPMSVRSLCRR